jgi:hypothetical protein
MAFDVGQFGHSAFIKRGRDAMLQRTLSILGMIGVLLCPLRADANSISIANVLDNTTSFSTIVTGTGVGFFPDVHFLVDIPGTPWVSSSTIFEVPGPPGPFPDVLRITWTIEHLLGPDPTDVNPNPLEPFTLSLTFVPTAPGPFGVFRTTFPCPLPLTPPDIFNLTAVSHPLTNGGSHFDDLCLAVSGTVTVDLLGHLDITSYIVTYDAVHCGVLFPGGFGCSPPIVPGGGVGGMMESPEPATFVLLGTGVLALRIKKRGATIRLRRRFFRPRSCTAPSPI